MASSQPVRQKSKKVEFAGMTLSNVVKEIAKEFGIDAILREL